ncbi:MAG: cyclase family protein [Firmicutes bacterium]|nr:cyclase family protein [Bacillota bacterium]
MKIFDLTGLLSEGMWDYGEPFVPYAMNRISSFEEDEYIASKIVFTSHTGTHVDCTRHFGEHRPSVEEIDLAKFIGKGKLADVSASCSEHEPITVDMLKDAGADKVQEGEILLVRTGWDKRWNTPGYEHDYPFMSVEAVEYIRDLGIKMFAADIPIIGDPSSIAADMVLCEAAIPSAYALVNLEQLPEEFTFAAFPLKIAAGDGSPVRAVAWTD